MPSFRLQALGLSPEYNSVITDEAVWLYEVCNDRVAVYYVTGCLSCLTIQLRATIILRNASWCLRESQNENDKHSRVSQTMPEGKLQIYWISALQHVGGLRRET